MSEVNSQVQREMDSSDESDSDESSDGSYNDLQDVDDNALDFLQQTTQLCSSGDEFSMRDSEDEDSDTDDDDDDDDDDEVTSFTFSPISCRTTTSA